MPPVKQASLLETKVRLILVGFMIGLFVSGITAFPLPQEIRMLSHWLGVPDTGSPASYSGLTNWIIQVRDGIGATEARFPFLFYGYDWLAFAHLVIALLFVGPVKDPVRNIWVVQWGMVACFLVIPLALICGPIRGIPFEWRLIDCAFGVVGVIPLVICYKWIKVLEATSSKGAV